MLEIKAGPVVGYYLQPHQTVRTLALSGLRQRHPEATPHELRRRLADLLLGPDLAALVYGPLEVQESTDVPELIAVTYNV